MKKYIALLGVLFVAVIVGIIAGGVAIKNSSTGTFTNGGFILGEGDEEEKSISFLKDTAYNITQTGTAEVENESGGTVSISASSFAHFTDGSTMALADGVLVDFADLSSNFINNYYISKTLPITSTGTAYTASTQSGNIEFGEHLWKISDDRYLINSNSLSVYFSDEDIREVNNFIEIFVTADGIVQILTEENVWMTISEECYIETEGGVKIYPVTQIIDDGTYKISIAKLIVSADDNIVLTEDELRRQIVPEIKIETEDGKDGEEGSSGTNGTDGTIGADGAQGTSGESGAAGVDGNTGSSGNSGVNGANGLKGLDATVESSTNTALPTMAISDWQVTEKSLQASIEVGGGAEALEIASEEYDGKITITNVATKEVIYCYETDSLYNIYDEAYNGINFRTAVGLSFSTKGEPLLPDTEYRLSVNAYYELNDVIYQREFIGRTFYTDSTGLQIVHTDSTEDTVTVDVSAMSDLGAVQVFLLTTKQNENFTIASSSDASNFVATTTLTPTSGAVLPYTFTGLETDTEYVVRAIVGGIISDQEVSMLTLKETPTWDESIDYPVEVFYNRINGTYEVYRPDVIDTDKGTVKYVYTAYNQDKGTVESSKTIYPGDAEPVVFNLTASTNYSFGVELYFNDNEKTITYDLGTSVQLTTEGTTLPKITWTGADDGIVGSYDSQYNTVKGRIGINLTGNSVLEVSPTNSRKLTIDIYADQVIADSYELLEEGDSQIATAAGNKISYTSQGSSNYAYIDVEFNDLLKNTNYTITISGYIDLQDGNGYVYRTLGTVSCRTLNTSSIVASFTNTDNASSAISQNLILTIQDDGTGGADESYVYQELLEGQVSISLYRGTGSTRVPLSTAYFTDSDLEKMYTKVAADGSTSEVSGVEITEDNFGLPDLSDDYNYTMVITEVVDDSYSISELGYQNVFDDVSPSSKVITAQATPPDLIADPTLGVKETPIYNINAVDYGAKYNDLLPDDTIIGYEIASQYDNSQRLGKTVTYYIYEYTEYYNALKTGKDPIKDDATTIREITLDVSSESDTVPKIAVFFDQVEFSASITEGSTYTNGCYIYTGGEGEETYTRGYRYLFAYTVDYTTNISDTTAQLNTYPYARSDYADYMNEYGCGKELGTVVGKNYAYILNSGMVSAPNATPDIYTYVADTTITSTSSAISSTSGIVTLHYSYSNDIDKTIIKDGEGEPTQILYEDNNGGDAYESVGKTQVESDWYEIALPYTVKQNATEQVNLTPILQIQKYVALDGISDSYDTILSDLSGGTYVEEPLYLAQIPVEYSYETMFDNASYDSKVNIIMTSYLKSNYIEFSLGDVETGNTAPREYLADRAVAMKLTFSPVYPKAMNAPETKVFYMPLTKTNFSSKVIFSTALLENDYIDIEFKVDAEMIYDTGSQGWKLLETQQPVAIQRTNTIDNDVVAYDYGAYYVGNNSLKYDKSGAILLEDSSTFSEDFLKSLRATSSGETYTRKYFAYMTNNYSLTRYLTVGHYGILDNQTTDLKSPSTYYIVPKKLESYPLNFDGGNTDTLDTIVPTVGSIVKNAAVDRIVVSSFEVTGHSQITASSSAEKEVTMYVYTSELSAQNNVVGDRVKDSTGNDIKLTVTIDENGKAVYKTEDTTTFNYLSGLTDNTQYFLAFTAIVDESETVLIDLDTAAKAVYEFFTVDGILLTPDAAGIYYRNDSYLEKSLEFTYSLNEYLGVDVAYNIYSSDDIKVVSEGKYEVITDNNGGNEVERTPVLSDANLRANNLLQAGSLYTKNNIVINLTPAEARNAIEPGKTYYMSVKASVGDSNNSQAILPFTIPPIGTVSALIYVDDATKDSLSFLVSIMDEQYSLMGDDEIEGTSGAPYVVRFTDEDGKRIYTTYDDEVFYAGNVQQRFELKKENLDGASLTATDVMKADTKYNMTVYSVLDDMHDGTSYPIATMSGDTSVLNQTTVQDKSYFLEPINGSYFTNLIDLINSFWYESNDKLGTNYDEMDIVEDNYSIASRLQTTTNDDNLYINEDEAIITINGSSRFELILEESYGVVTTVTDEDDTTTTTQYFDEIEYTISGRNNTTITGFEETGTSVDPDDTLFIRTTDSVGYSIYTYEIPVDVPKGTYTVTVHLKKTGYEDITFSSKYTYN